MIRTGKDMFNGQNETLSKLNISCSKQRLLLNTLKMNIALKRYLSCVMKYLKNICILIDFSNPAKPLLVDIGTHDKVY